MGGVQECKNMLTFVPAKMGTCKKFPLAIWSEGRAVIKLPGGPTDGCHNWPFKVACVIATEISFNVWMDVSFIHDSSPSKGANLERELL